MTPIEALQASIDALQSIVGDKPIADDQLGDPTPCQAFTVEHLGDHIIDTHNFLLSAAGGKPVDRGGSFAKRHAAVGAASVTQWTKRGTDGTVDLGGNELPAEFGLSLHVLETYVHAWDLALGLGRVFAPSAALTEMAWEVAQQIVSDDARGDSDDAPYGRAVKAGKTADPIERLIDHTGRDPRNPLGR